MMYKIGFTSFNSAKERFSFQESEDEKYIDSVLFFLNFQDAWDIEQQLHNHFKKNRLFSGFDEKMPFYKNGQSELYAEDVLKMDDFYTDQQAEKTRINIDVFNYKIFGATDEQCKLLIESENKRFEKYRIEKMKSKEFESSLIIRSIIFLLKPFVLIISLLFDFIFRMLFAQSIADEARINALIERIRRVNMEERNKEKIRREKYNELVREVKKIM